MDPSPTGERYSGSKGGLCGCFAAIGFAAPVGLVVLIGTIMGDCFPGDPCHDNDQRNLLIAAAIVLALAALVGFAVRALFNWRMQRLFDPHSAGRPPIWAIAVLIPLLILGLWCLWGVLPFHVV